MAELITRPAVESDLASLVALYNHYIESSPATFDIEVNTVTSWRPWFEQYAVTGPHRLLVAERDGGVVGFASSRTFRAKAAYAQSVEASVYLAHGVTGHGVGVLLYESLFAILAEAEVHRIYAGITLPNDPSIALHRRFGFEEVGHFDEVGYKFGQYWSVKWFEKRLR